MGVHCGSEAQVSSALSLPRETKVAKDLTLLGMGSKAEADTISDSIDIGEYPINDGKNCILYYFRCFPDRID